MTGLARDSLAASVESLAGPAPRLAVLITGLDGGGAVGAGAVREPAGALAHYRLAIDKLDRHGARNSGYERNRAATQAKIAALAAKVSKHP